MRIPTQPNLNSSNVSGNPGPYVDNPNNKYMQDLTPGRNLLQKAQENIAKMLEQEEKHPITNQLLVE